MPDSLSIGLLGAGRCQIAELRRRDIDLKRGTITVARGVTWPSVRDPETGMLISEAVVGTPKTAAGLREVHIPPHILPAVEAHLAEHKKLVAEVSAFKKKFDSGQAAISVELMGFLRDWLLNHILKVDKHLAQHLVSAGHGGRKP